MTTNFGTKIALCERETRQLVMEGERFEWAGDRLQILPIPCT